jgi:hypothetical protein
MLHETSDLKTTTKSKKGILFCQEEVYNPRRADHSFTSLVSIAIITVIEGARNLNNNDPEF